MAKSRISPAPTKIECLSKRLNFMAQTLERVAKHPNREYGIIIIEDATKEKIAVLNSLASWLILAGLIRSGEMMKSGEFIWTF
ncbi:MAG TPA: hypothetical protein VMV75_03370 [Sulfuricella sp.]|nr:hypothetical protein [Sulfuricella sp.]